jgi:hypothetical protein
MACRDTEARLNVSPLLDLTPQQLAQLQAQLNVIQTYWIQFVVVCLAAITLIWVLMQWLYKARIEKMKHLFELANAETEIKTKKVDRLQDELIEKVESFTKEIESLKKTVDTPEISSPLAEKVSSLTKNMSSIKTTVGELGKANNDVSVSVRGTSWAPPMAAGMIAALRDLDGFGALRKLDPDTLDKIKDIGKPFMGKPPGRTLNSLPDDWDKRE